MNASPYGKPLRSVHAVLRQGGTSNVLHGRDGRRYDADELRARLANAAADLASELLPGGHRSGKNYFASDVHGGSGDSLALNLRGRYAGLWKDFAEDTQGDLLDLWCVRYGVRFADAIDQAARHLGLDPLPHDTTPARDGGPVLEIDAGNRELGRELRICRRLDHIADRLAHMRKRRRVALYLWRRRRPIVPGTPAWRYLTETRGLAADSLPETVAWLPESEKHPPAIIAAFGLPLDLEPGRLVMPDRCVRGVQLLRLSSDGAEKIGKAVTIGHCPRSPLVVAPFNDLLGLYLVEGLEDALTLAEVDQAGVWACGGASRMASVARAVPRWTDWLTLWRDDDPAGAKATTATRAALLARGFDGERIEIKQFRAPGG